MKKVFSYLKFVAVMLLIAGYCTKFAKARIYDEPSKLKMFETQDKDKNKGEDHSVTPGSNSVTPDSWNKSHPHSRWSFC